MFKKVYEFSFECNALPKTVWEFYMNPENWPSWNERFDSFSITDELKSGTKIFGKVRGRKKSVLILATDVKPFSEFRYCIRGLGTTVESLTQFCEINSGTTTVTCTVYIHSIFFPFIRRKFEESLIQANAHCKSAVTSAVSDSLSRRNT